MTGKDWFICSRKAELTLLKLLSRKQGRFLKPFWRWMTGSTGEALESFPQVESWDSIAMARAWLKTLHLLGHSYVPVITNSVDLRCLLEEHIVYWLTATCPPPPPQHLCMLIHKPHPSSIFKWLLLLINLGYWPSAGSPCMWLPARCTKPFTSGQQKGCDWWWDE